MTRSVASGLGRSASWIAALFLAWRALAGLPPLAREVGALAPRASRAMVESEDERIRDAMARWERRAGLAPGSQWALFEALRREVPLDGQVYFVARRDAKGALAFSHAKVLLYPRRLYAQERVPPNWREVLKPKPNLFLLELDGPFEESLSERFELVAEGADFRLWRSRGGGG